MITKIPELKKGKIEPLESILDKCQEAIDNGEYSTDCPNKGNYVINSILEAPNKFLRYLGVK